MSGGVHWKGLWDPKRAEPEGTWTQGSFRAESRPTSASHLYHGQMRQRKGRHLNFLPHSPCLHSGN